MIVLTPTSAGVQDLMHVVLERFPTDETHAHNLATEKEGLVLRLYHKESESWYCGYLSPEDLADPQVTCREMANQIVELRRRNGFDKPA